MSQEPPRTTYVVLSHRWPEQILRLARAIRAASPTASVLVHHDARQVPAPRAQEPWLTVRSVTQRSDWGSWQIVERTLEALELAVQATGADAYVLVSGQDYPTRPLHQWEAEFRAGGYGWQGEATPLRYTPRWGRGHGTGADDLTRYAYLWWPLPRGRWLATSDRTVPRATRTLLYHLGHYAEPVLDVRDVTRGRGLHVGLRNPRPPFGPGQPCVKGSQWFAVDRPTLAAVLREHRSGAWRRWCFRHSIIPDESYLQTILSAVAAPSPDGPVTAVDWDVAADQPRTITLADLPRLRAGAAPFCRKVDPVASAPLMQALDGVTHA